MRFLQIETGLACSTVFYVALRNFTSLRWKCDPFVEFELPKPLYICWALSGHADQLKLRPWFTTWSTIVARISFVTICLVAHAPLPLSVSHTSQRSPVVDPHLQQIDLVVRIPDPSTETTQLLSTCIDGFWRGQVSIVGSLWCWCAESLTVSVYDLSLLCFPKETMTTVSCDMWCIVFVQTALRSFSVRV